MAIVRKLVLALALIVGGLAATPRHAHAQTTEEIQQAGVWATEYQRIVAVFLAPLQATPGPPVADMSRAERRVWAAATREWATSAQATFTEVRADLQRLPPFPFTDGDNAETRNAIESSLPRLRESIDAGDRITSAYLALADAVERNQMNQINSIRLVALDGAMVTMRLFQDINAAQAAAMEPGNPNRSLALSYTYSYEALWVILNFKREVMSGLDNRVITANAVASVAQRMRAVVVAGRADADLLRRQLNDPAIAASVAPGLLPRLHAMVETFPESFAREEELANDLEAMAAILREQGDYATIEPAFDQRMEVFAAREASRAADIQRRVEIMSAP